MKKGTTVDLITDCKCPNAAGRVETRSASLFPWGKILTPTGVGSEYEAALCLVDKIDALESRHGVILVNVAPRNGKGKRWPNGTPFGELLVGNAHIFSTVDGYTLSLLQDVMREKLNVRLYDIPEVVCHLGLASQVQTRIINSQFRSFDFLPRLAAARVRGIDLPFTAFSEVPTLPEIIAYTDNFGNMKTSVLFRGQFEPGQTLSVRVEENPCLQAKFYSRLADVPDGELAVDVGSSGLGELRFLEIVVQGVHSGSAASRFGNPLAGTRIEIK